MKTSNSGIVLLAKRPGRTSFSSLFTIKKALHTKKVGHTGTLDSFASGLLVVCTGSLTRLSSRITAFDKSYEAVICFGKETDTLDPCGEVVRTAELPTFSQFKKSLEKFSGKIMQAPPAFSAIHVNGHRASELARSGNVVQLPKRPVFVYKTELKEIQFDDGTAFSSEVFADSADCPDFAGRKVLYARVMFEVSSGTYIRSLARDIGIDCSSAAFLAGLLRTTVGKFQLKDAAGYSFLPDFSIKNVVESLEIQKSENSGNDEADRILLEEIPAKLNFMTPELAEDCGFFSVVLLKKYEFQFFNGRPLNFKFFKNYTENPDFSVSGGEKEVQFAVFSEENVFCGIINMNKGRLYYGYVVPKAVEV